MEVISVLARFIDRQLTRNDLVPLLVVVIGFVISVAVIY